MWDCFVFLLVVYKMPDKFIIKLVCIYVCSLFLFSSFKQGLKTLGVLEKIQTYPDVFHKILCRKPENLSAKTLSDLFTVHGLPDGQTLRFWNSYLQAVEGM